MIRRPIRVALGALFALMLAAATGCVREKPVPPAAPPKPQTIPPSQFTNRDITGKPRTPGQGVTPGALEPEPPPPRPPNKEPAPSKPPASPSERR